jgi:AraC family transcriptional regulator, L-rhamnose operon transcriptional activator RhaR
MSSKVIPVRLLGKDFFLPDHVPIRVMRSELNESVPMHDHDFMELVLILNGSCTHRTIFGDQTVGRGDAFILRPGAWHAYLDPGQLDLYECRFGMELLQRELAWTQEDPALELMFWAAPESLDRRGLIHVTLPPDAVERCEQLLSGLTELTQREPEFGKTEAIGGLLLFFSEIGREVTNSVQAMRKGKPEPHQAVTDGIRIMEEDIRRDWTLPELAKRLKVDKSYLVRLFRSQTGLPPMQFLAKIRAERAAVLLLRTNRDISVIGEQVGWDDPNYFARRFKAEFGISATKYRDKFAKDSAMTPTT